MPIFFLPLIYKMLRKKLWKKRAARRRPARRIAKRSKVVVNRALHPIPQRFITKMKYGDYVSTDATGQYKFNLNSLWDPNRTGTGGQPYLFDSMASLYNRYRVISCGWRIQCMRDSAAIAIQLGAVPANEDLTLITMSQLRELPRAKYVLQNPGANVTTLKGKCYLPSLVGRTKAQYMADDSYQAQVTGSPGELCILNLLTTNNADSTAGLISIQVLLEYTVEFFDVKTLGRS